MNYETPSNHKIRLTRNYIKWKSMETVYVIAYYEYGKLLFVTQSRENREEIIWKAFEYAGYTLSSATSFKLIREAEED
jgi:hypothetical protein